MEAPQRIMGIYADAIKHGLRLGGDDGQQIVWEAIRDHMINTCGLSPLAAANLTRVMFEAVSRELTGEGVYTAAELETIHGIITAELAAN